MSEIETRRMESAQRRQKPVMVELPAGPPLTPSPPDLDDLEGEPRVRYWVRCGGYTVEIATAEDWYILDQSLYQPSRDRLEIWAQHFEADCALRLHPSDELTEATAATILLRQFERARPDVPPPEDDDMFAPEYHPGLTIAQAKADFERVYRERMGQGIFLPTPDGPARPAKELEDEEFRRRMQAMGAPITETPDGPVVIAGKYVDGKLAEPADKYEDVT